MRQLLLTLLAWCLLAPAPVFGATPATPPVSVWLVPKVEAPFWGNSPLELTLVPDEKACRKAYGDEWEQGCAAAFGVSGVVADGVSITPPVEGEWRWLSAETLQFMPKNPWPPQQRYDVSLKSLPLPGRVRLSPHTATITTPVPAVQIGRGEVWVDPDDKGSRAISFALHFRTPPDKAAVARHMTLTADDPALRLSPPEIIWMDDGVRGLVQARILSLAPKDSLVNLSLPGFAPLVETHSDWTIVAKTKDSHQSLKLPGQEGLFQIRSARLERATDPDLSQGLYLTLETSLRVTPAALRKALSAIQLPATNTPEALRPYAWKQAPNVAPDDLNRGKPVRVSYAPNAGGNENEPASRMRFRVEADAESYVFLALPAGFGPAGTGLAKPWQEVFQADAPQKIVRILQPGNVLTLGGDRKLDLYSRGLDRIHWRIGRIQPRFLALMSANINFRGENGWFDRDTTSQVWEGVIDLSARGGSDTAQPRFSVLDLAPMLEAPAVGGEAFPGAGSRGVLYIELRGEAKGEDESWDQRAVLVTDLGLLLKRNADGSRELFVTGIRSGQPVADVTVSVLAANGLSLAETRTDAEGRAHLPPVDGFTREKAAVAVLAEHSQNGLVDAAYLPLRDVEREVDLSRFNVGGRTSAAEGLNAFVFSQRGIFRPGETLHFGMLVRRADWAALPPDLPFQAVLVDPTGVDVSRRTFSVGKDGLADFSWTSPESASTGRYRLHVSTPDGLNGKAEGEVLGSTSVLVQDFQPDTLAIAAKITPAPGRGWLRTSAAQAEITLRNLYGMPATNRLLRADLAVRPATLTFPGFAAYTFHDAAAFEGEALTRTLPEQRTDAEGKAILPLGLETLRQGTVACELRVEGFEPGEGRAVTLFREILVSPLEAVLGWRPDGAASNPDFIPHKSAGAFAFVALDSELRRTDPGPLRFEVAARRYVTSLVTDASGRYRYDETPVDTPLSSSELRVDPASLGDAASVADSLVWPVPTETPGEFLLTVRQADGTIMARIPYTVAGNDLRLVENAQEPTLPSGLLRLRLDKTDYLPGGTAKLFLAAPYAGTALLTLERDRVFTHRWVTLNAGNNVQEIPIPADFEGRGYVSAALIRAADAPEIFMQPLSVAVAPLSVNVERRDMGLRLAAPALVQPGESIDVTLTARVPGKALLFAVDEGVLQLTHFSTPDPLDYLLNDRALEVRTMQALDLLMPEHSRLAGLLPAFGGGMGLEGGRFQNPFKRKHEPPLAFWSTLVDVGPDAQSVRIAVPDYVNSRIRIMAVGSGPDNAGQSEAAVLVRGPLVLTPQTPAFVAPGDAFEASLAVANNAKEGDGVLTLRTEADPALNFSDPALAAAREIRVAPGAEAVFPFSVKVGDVLGNAELRFVVTDAAGKETRRSAFVSVRPASSWRETSTVGRLSATPGKQLRLTPERTLYPYEARTSASVSLLPLPAVRGLGRYLDSYPYGCVEQLISRAFPASLFARLPELSVSDKAPEDAAKESRRLMEAALQAIQGALGENGVRPWLDSGQEDTLLTAYAGDYLLSLREANLALPGGLATRLFDALEQRVNGTPQTPQEARAMAYGIWVLTREGRITTRSLEQLSQSLEAFPGWENDVTATLMAGSYALLRMDTEARTLLPDAGRGTPFISGTGSRMDSLAADALNLTLLARHFPDQLSAQADALAERLLEQIRGGYTTFSAAQGVRALLSLATVPGGTPGTVAAADALNGVSLTCVAWQPDFAAPGKDAPGAPGAAGTANATTRGAASGTEATLLNGVLRLDAPGCAAFALAVAPAATSGTTSGAIPTMTWELSSSGFDRTPPTTALAEGLELNRTFSIDGQPLADTAQTSRIDATPDKAAGKTARPAPGKVADKTGRASTAPAHSVPLGQVVNVTLDLRALGTNVDNVVLVDLIPGGFELALPRTNDEEPLLPEGARMERHEDRVLIFVNATLNPQTFSYRLRAVNRGSFTLPPAQGEAMYDRTVRASTAAGRMTVN